MAQIDPLLVHIKENDGSDLHLVAGQPPRFRAKGSIQAVEGQSVLTHDSLRSMMKEVATTRAWDEYEATGDLDFAFSLEGVATHSRKRFARSFRRRLRLSNHSRRDHLPRRPEAAKGGL